MIKNLFIILFLVLSSFCFGQTLPLKNGKECKTTGYVELEFDNITKKILGNWVYSYSYFEDSCFYISNLGDLSNNYSFNLFDTNTIRFNLPKLYSFGTGKLLFGLVSFHEDKPFGKKTYPLVNNYEINFLRITHYVGNSLGKAYSYFLESIDSNNLVLYNERYYELNGKKKTGVRHVYLKQ